ncbi:RDD family protein [Phytomonospora sp. NPDC050363]|uniref:RDD family protein n=1 Tax=Phytomonospora sp. NPDC050363 TaxID=3155642 RepID=UPI003407E6DE
MKTPPAAPYYLAHLPHPNAFPPVRGGVPLADVGQRIAAFIIDQLVLGPVFFVLWLPVQGIIGARFGMEYTQAGDPVRATDPQAQAAVLGIYTVMLLTLMILTAVYQTVCVAQWGATVGKKAMKLRVIRAADGGAVGWSQATGRASMAFAFGMFPCLGYLDGGWAMWDRPNRQALHDKAAGTIVVRTDHVYYGARAVFRG